jgi:hypothetical protein
MDAPERGALMLVRFIAVALMVVTVVGTGLYVATMLPAQHHTCAGGKFFPMLHQFHLHLWWASSFDQSQARHRGMDFDKLE